LRRAKYLSEGKVKLAGTLSPVVTLLRGKEEDVRRAVIRAVQEGIDLVSPGCSLSPLTPSANISSMVQAVRELESTRDTRVNWAGSGLENVSVNYEVAKIKHPATAEAPEVHVEVEPILAELATAVVEGNLDEVQKRTKKALETLEPAHVIRNGLVAGISTVSKMWDRGEYFLPEVILASDAMQAGVRACEEKMQAAYEREGKVITFVAEGDIHDIGKSIVISFLRASGYEVLDLGKNVADADVVRAVLKERPLLICGSALMTTTMSAFPRIAEVLMKNGVEVPLAIGGGAVTQEFAESFPLGIYGEKPNDAVLAAELSKKGVSWRDIRRRIVDANSGGVEE
jgi:methanol corrinoid protein